MSIKLTKAYKLDSVNLKPNKCYYCNRTLPNKKFRKGQYCL